MLLVVRQSFFFTIIFCYLIHFLRRQNITKLHVSETFKMLTRVCTLRLLYFIQNIALTLLSQDIIADFFILCTVKLLSQIICNIMAKGVYYV